METSCALEAVSAMAPKVRSASSAGTGIRNLDAGPGKGAISISLTDARRGGSIEPVRRAFDVACDVARRGEVAPGAAMVDVIPGC